jgi:predicted phage tail protein
MVLPRLLYSFGRVKSQNVNLDIKAFCALHEMHTQFRHKMVEGKKKLSSTLVAVVLSLRERCQTNSTSF